ncbi:ABC transporter permease [Micromonospora yangpuensis]|uniref:ABC transporter permease n=1 Tax=Micromonospora yangpuensis TaxID=683228 RepID=UPI00198CDF51|nr:transport permease protein [Micromonospora yangpuensis]
MVAVTSRRPARPRVPAWTVLVYYLTNYRRTWRAGLFSSFFLPLLTVVGFGLGVGSYVDQGLDGVSYLHWIVPGLLLAGILQVAVLESTFPVFSGFQWSKIYFGQYAAPLRVGDIVAGHLAFVVFRVLTAAIAFLLVTAAFGALRSFWAVAVLPVIVLFTLAMITPIFAFSASVPTDTHLTILFRFAVLPMTLFSGVFFPVESLPTGLRQVAYLSPLWHAVDLCRAATLGMAPQWSIVGHLLYLAAWAVVGWVLARRAFRRRLVV